LRNELQEGERCRLSCDGRGFFYCTTCLTRIDSNRTNRMRKWTLLTLTLSKTSNQKVLCQDDDALMAENEVKLAGRASSHSPDPESPASLPSSLSEKRRRVSDNLLIGDGVVSGFHRRRSRMSTSLRSTT